MRLAPLYPSSNLFGLAALQGSGPSCVSCPLLLSLFFFLSFSHLHSFQPLRSGILLPSSFVPAGAFSNPFILSQSR